MALKRVSSLLYFCCCPSMHATKTRTPYKFHCRASKAYSIEIFVHAINITHFETATTAYRKLAVSRETKALRMP